MTIEESSSSSNRSFHCVSFTEARFSSLSDQHNSHQASNQFPPIEVRENFDIFG